MRPRPGAGKWGSNEATRARPAPPSPAARPSRLRAAAREWLGVGLNPLVQAASPLLLLAGQLRGAISAMDVAGLRQHALDEMRRFEDRARAAGVRERDRADRALRAVRDGGRSRLVHAVGLAERVGAAPPAGDLAPRSVGRREVLRDARSHLTRSGSTHRPDGVAVSLHRVRVRRQVSTAGPRARAAGGRRSRTSIARFAATAAHPTRNCRCAGAVSKTAATR